MSTKTRLIIVASAILIVVVLVTIGVTTKAQASQTNAQVVILNLLNGQQYFGVPHVYQGDNGGTLTNQWPVYYGPNNASQYWSQGNITSNQPVLELVPGPMSGGAMFWSETYSGGSITITIQATASIVVGGTPFQVYLFLKPTMWGISPQYNYTIPYNSIYPWPVGGDVILPQSSTSYLIIQWAPVWHPAAGVTGQWNVWIVSNPSGNNASVGPYPSPNLGDEGVGWEGIGTVGTGFIYPNPGDRINITVTYDPSTNTLSGVATDLNTTQSASFTLNLSGYFTPPSSGNYVFGVGAATYDLYGGNGALLYVATTQQPTTLPPQSLSSLTVQVFNALGRPATTVPGVVFGVLYNSSGFSEVAFMNSSGYLNFYGVPPGTYMLKVYHYPNTGFNYTEYWGSETIDVQPGYNVVNFTRDEPWIYGLQPVYVNGQVVVNVTIDNPLSTTLSAYVYLWVATNPSTANPNQPTATQPITMHPGLNKYTFHYPASQTGTYYVYAAVLTYISTYTVTDQWGWTATTSPQNYQVVLNLLNGQQYFGVPHVYMGYYGFFPANVTTQWPAYYSPLNASLYWSLAGISSNQPVLELLGARLGSSGAMYWPTYYEGGNITISFITVYTTVNSTFGSPSPISVYLFIKPLGWGISSMYNFSIPCASPLAFVIINSTYGFLPVVPMIPWSTANYLIVTWFPANQYQWTIKGVNTNLTYLGGNGTVKPKPGDLLNVTITYNLSTNTIYGMIRDLNTSETSTFTASLSGNFTPPSPGYYVFGIGTASEWEIHCGTACCSCTAPIPFKANWALLYAAVSQQPITPPPTYYSVNFTEVGLPPGTAWNVTLNGVTKVSSSSSIIFTVPNGEYNYSVASPILVNGVEYVATKPSGTVTVNNTNVTVTVQYVPVSTTEKLEVYSQFVKYFYSGFNLPNRFFVAAPSINGNQPSSVTGYIAGANVTLSFTYNPSSGYWVSNEVNMGVLKPGSYELTVYAVYGNNYVVEGTYSIIVLEPPPIVLTILSYIPIPNQAFELKLSNLGEFSIPLGIGYEWSLEKHITGLFNNTYEIKAKVILKYALEQDVPKRLLFLSGKYSTSLELPIFVTLNSSGVVSIGGGISKNLKLTLGPANVDFTVGGSAQGNLAISSYQVVLQSIDASAFLSAYGTYNIPTPWGYEFSIDDIAEVQIGLIVSISLGASAHVKAVLIPVNNPNSTIPLAFKDVSGNVFIPFGIEGTVGASVHVDGGGKDYGTGDGAAAGLQGVAGVGFLLIPGGSSLLESPGGAMVGEVNAFVVVKLVLHNLIEIKYQGSWTILGPGVLYEWGSVPNSDIVSFEDELQQAAQQFQWQVISSDWVNGSTFGIITNNTSFGYGYSITNYNGLVYIYYTELAPSGVAVIRGLVFNGTTAMRAPLPTFNDLGEASPLLVTLNNGSLMMLWAGVPMGTYNLNNLTILLQGSVLNNNTWGPVVNLTKSGDAMSYASDGEYIYLVYEPKLSLTYNNTVLEELTPTGVVVRALSIPGIVGIIGVSNGLVVVQFINGTYALVNMNTGVVEPINASIAGFSSGLLYYFYNGTLTVVNGTQRLAISLPIYAYAFPVAWSHGLVIIAWRPGLLSVFNWNGTTLQPIRNYTTAFTIVPGASIIDNTLYLTWFGLVNTTNGHGSIYMAIQPLPHPTNQSTTTTTTTVNVATTTSSVSTSTSSVTTPTTSSTSTKPTHGAIPTWVTAAVVVIVVVVLIVALLMSRRGSR